MKIIGIYKELDDDEKILKETPQLVEVHQERGLTFLGIKIGSQTPDTSFARLYLTNKKLMFLTFFVGNLSELKSGKGDIQGITADWSEIPINQIKNVEASKLGLMDLLFSGDKEDKGELVIDYGKSSRITVILQQRDMWKALLDEYCPNLDYKTKKGMLEEFNKGLEELNKGFSEGFQGGVQKTYARCHLCGTNYELNSVKMVTCEGCGKEVCREAKVKTGILSSAWKKTKCFNDRKMLCKSCSKKST